MKYITSKAQSLEMFRRWIGSKYGLTLDDYDKWLQREYDTTLKIDLANNWNWHEIGYLHYVITEGIEDKLHETYPAHQPTRGGRPT